MHKKSYFQGLCVVPQIWCAQKMIRYMFSLCFISTQPPPQKKKKKKKFSRTPELQLVGWAIHRGRNPLVEHGSSAHRLSVGTKLPRFSFPRGLTPNRWRGWEASPLNHNTSGQKKQETNTWQVQLPSDWLEASHLPSTRKKSFKSTSKPI